MHLHDYETTFIFSSDLDEAEQNRLTEKLTATVTNNGGELMVFEDWGRRRLAYNIKKSTHGRYLFFNYLAAPEVPAALERVIKIEDNIVRFLTIVNDRHVDPDEARLVARGRQRKRLARAQAGSVVDSGDSRGRGRAPRESMLAPVPVSAPTGTAIQAAGDDDDPSQDDGGAAESDSSDDDQD